MHTADWYVTSALLMICLWISRDEGFPLTFRGRSFRESKNKCCSKWNGQRKGCWSVLRLKFWQIITNINNFMADLTTKKLKNVSIINGIIALSTLLTLDLYNYYTELTVLTQKDAFFFNVQRFSENNTENICIWLILESVFICIFACVLQWRMLFYWLMEDVGA